MRRLAILLCMIMLTGCGSALDTAIRAANGAETVATHAHAVLVEDTRGAYDGCVARETRPEALACIEVVRQRYAPAWTAYRALRHTWLSLAALIQGAIAADGPMPAGYAILVGSLAQAVTELQAAIEGTP